MTTLTIRRQKVTEDITRQMDGGFRRHALAATGTDGMRGESVAFVAADGEKVAGVAVVMLFWGQLRVRNLIVEEGYRGKGIATSLMNAAHDYGRENGCRISYVETMNFQALEFYQKLGYEVEFVREGFAANASYIYLKKYLKEANDA